MITKKEIIWREILKKATQREQLEFIQKDLAQKFGFSVSTVFNALRIPRSQGAVKVTGRNFLVVDAEKLLYIWATQRNLEKDLIYKTFSPANAKEIEGLMPPGIIFGAYSAFVHKFGDAPADYDKVYVYAGEFELAELKKRFPKIKGNPNVFALRKDNFLETKDGIAPAVQTFVDLWNLKDWYAGEFLKELKEKIIR